MCGIIRLQCPPGPSSCRTILYEYDGHCGDPTCTGTQRYLINRPSLAKQKCKTESCSYYPNMNDPRTRDYFLRFQAEPDRFAEILADGIRNGDIIRVGEYLNPVLPPIGEDVEDASNAAAGAITNLTNIPTLILFATAATVIHVLSLSSSRPKNPGSDEPGRISIAPVSRNRNDNPSADAPSSAFTPVNPPTTAPPILRASVSRPHITHRPTFTKTSATGSPTVEDPPSTGDRHSLPMNGENLVLKSDRSSDVAQTAKSPSVANQGFVMPRKRDPPPPDMAKHPSFTQEDIDDMLMMSAAGYNSKQIELIFPGRKKNVVASAISNNKPGSGYKKRLELKAARRAARGGRDRCDDGVDRGSGRGRRGGRGGGVGGGGGNTISV